MVIWAKKITMLLFGLPDGQPCGKWGVSVETLKDRQRAGAKLQGVSRSEQS